jgi:hypothetical protein
MAYSSTQLPTQKICPSWSPLSWRHALFWVTFNIRDYEPGHPDVTVLKPGEFVLRVRDLLAHLEVKLDDSD